MFDPGLEPSIRVIGALATALRRASPDAEARIQTFNHSEPVLDTLPRFSSGVDAIDEALGGGFFGTTVIASEAGVGKTALALKTGLIAAANPGTFVVWFCAELDEAAMARRFDSVVQAEPDLEDAISRFVVVHADFGCTPMTLTSAFEQAVDPYAERFLLVLDSINTIADNDTGPYLDRLKRFALWAMRSRILAPGDLSWLVVSETNAAGGIKGGKLSYWADVVLRIRGEKDRGVVNLEIAKSRTGGEGDLGKFVRDWHRQTFVEPGKARRLYAVGSDWEEM